MHRLIEAVSIPALSGNSSALAPVFILEVGHLKFYYQPGAAILDHFANPGTTPEHLWIWSSHVYDVVYKNDHCVLLFIHHLLITCRSM